jgi:hypothetical protein
MTCLEISGYRTDKDCVKRAVRGSAALYWIHRHMNVERTMEFILQQQAKAEVRMTAMREQQARYEKQHAEEHAKIDRQMKQFKS